MKKENRFLKFLKTPDGWFCCLLWLFTLLFVAGAAVLAARGADGWVACLLYACTAVFFGYSVYTVVIAVPRIKARVIRRAKRHRFTANFVGSYGFRTVVFAVGSFVINVAYAVSNAVLAAVVSSVWYAALAGYYLTLSALRFGILLGSYKLRQKSGTTPEEFYFEKLKVYRGCGIFLLVLEISLAGAVTQMVLSESPVLRTKIMAIASAAYTFYKIALAVYNLIKVRRYGDPVLQCFRNINLMDAAVSLLALQTTMVSVFSDGGTGDMKTLSAICGFSVCALTSFLGIFMIVRAGRKLKRREVKEEYERTE